MTDHNMLTAVRAYMATMLPKFLTTARIVRWSTALDNYEPCPRAYGRGYGIRFWHQLPEVDSVGRDALVLFGVEQLRDAYRSVYVIDDGSTAVPMYVAGWNPSSETVRIHLHAYPLSVGTSPDGRPIDMSGQVFGPRRSYHLKITNLPTTTPADIVDRLNVWEGAHPFAIRQERGLDVWQDIILGLDEFDEVATGTIDGSGGSDRFALTDGTVIRYDRQARRWYQVSA